MIEELPKCASTSRYAFFCVKDGKPISKIVVFPNIRSSPTSTVWLQGSCSDLSQVGWACGMNESRSPRPVSWLPTSLIAQLRHEELNPLSAVPKPSPKTVALDVFEFVKERSLKPVRLFQGPIVTRAPDSRLYQKRSAPPVNSSVPQTHQPAKKVKHSDEEYGYHFVLTH